MAKSIGQASWAGVDNGPELSPDNLKKGFDQIMATAAAYLSVSINGGHEDLTEGLLIHMATVQAVAYEALHQRGADIDKLSDRVQDAVAKLLTNKSN